MRTRHNTNHQLHFKAAMFFLLHSFWMTTRESMLFIHSFIRTHRQRAKTKKISNRRCVCVVLIKRLLKKRRGRKTARKSKNERKKREFVNAGDDNYRVDLIPFNPNSKSRTNKSFFDSTNPLVLCVDIKRWISCESIIFDVLQMHEVASYCAVNTIFVPNVSSLTETQFHIYTKWNDSKLVKNFNYFILFWCISQT